MERTPVAWPIAVGDLDGRFRSKRRKHRYNVDAVRTGVRQEGVAMTTAKDLPEASSDHPQRSPLGTSPSRFAAPSPPERRRRWAVSRATWLCAVTTAVGVLTAIAATTAFASSGGTTAGTSWYGFSGGGGPAALVLLNSPAGGPVGHDANAYIATKRKPTPISAASAFVLPSAQKCVVGAHS